MRYEALSQENATLRGLRTALPPVAEKWLVAEVVRDVDNLRPRVMINRGTANGVFKGQAVMDDSGILGQTTHVGPWSAEVILITDPEHQIPVEIERTGLRTIAEGRDDGALGLPYLPANADIKVGDLLRTSGMGGVFPQGYPVGEGGGAQSRGRAAASAGDGGAAGQHQSQSRSDARVVPRGASPLRPCATPAADLTKGDPNATAQPTPPKPKPAAPPAGAPRRARRGRSAAGTANCAEEQTKASAAQVGGTGSFHRPAPMVEDKVAQPLPRPIRSPCCRPSAKGMPNTRRWKPWAHGLPSLLTQRATCRKALSTGLRSPSIRTSRQIADGLRRLMGHRPTDERKAMGAPDGPWSRAEFSWPVVASQFEDGLSLAARLRLRRSASRRRRLTCRSFADDKARALPGARRCPQTSPAGRSPQRPRRCRPRTQPISRPVPWAYEATSWSAGGGGPSCSSALLPAPVILGTSQVKPLTPASTRVCGM